MKVEFDDQESFLGFAKSAGVTQVGVQIAVKNENAGAVRTEKSVVQGVQTSAVLILTAVARTKTGSEDHLLHQRPLASKLLLSPEDEKKANEEIDAARDEVFKAVQAGCSKAVIINGRILP